MALTLRTVFRALLILFVLGSSRPASAFIRDYLPLPDGRVARPFPLHPILQDDATRNEKTLPLGRFRGSLRILENGDIQIEGRDDAGRPWSYRLGLNWGYRAYSADLDLNGREDLLLLEPTMGNGLAPPYHLIVLMIDAGGRPVPFRAEGYFGIKAGKSEAIEDLVDLDRDGRAELIHMCFSDGYWITNLYQPRDARWKRLEGPLAGRSYPLFTRFTYRSNRKPVQPRRGRHPEAPELGNLKPVMTGRLEKYQWADVSHSEDITLFLRPSGSQTIREAQPVSWYSTFAVVIDGPDGRRVSGFSGDDEVIRGMLDEIVKKGYEVSIYGQRTSEHPSPEMLWATVSADVRPTDVHTPNSTSSK